MTAGISDKKQSAGWDFLRLAGEDLGHVLVGKAATEALLQLAERHADPRAQTQLNNLEKCQKKEADPPAGPEKTVTVGQLTQQENFRKLEGALDDAQRALVPGSVDLKTAGMALQRAGKIVDKVWVPLDLRHRYEALQKNYRREGALQSMAQFREEHRGDPVYEGYTEAQWKQLSDHFATEAEKGSANPGNRINLDLNADTVSERKFSSREIRAEANAWFLTGSADTARSFSPVAVVDDLVDTVETVRDTGLSPATVGIIAIGVADAVIPGKAMDAAADKARAVLRSAGGFVGDTTRRMGDAALGAVKKGKKADVTVSAPRLDSPPSSVNPDSLPVVSPPSNLPAANGPGGNVTPIQQPKPAVVENNQVGEIQQASGGENFEVSGPAATPETASRQNNALLKAPPPSHRAPQFQPQGSKPASSAPDSGLSEQKARGSHLRLVKNGHFEIEISKGAAKDLKTLPKQVRLKLEDWQKAVDIHGLEEVKKVGSFHDEPLKGNRLGQHSIRLNGGYRAFYRIRQDNKIELLEVNKHDY